MAFTVKKGDLVYASDATLGFVEDVFRPREAGDDMQRATQRDADAGWAAVRVPEINALVYFTAADVFSRDEAVPSVLLTLTHAEATADERRRAPGAVARGQAPAEEVSPLDVGRPEAARTPPLGELGDQPGPSAPETTG